MHSARSPPPYLKTSAGIPSGPLALQLFSADMAFFTSCNVGGQSISSIVECCGIQLIAAVSASFEQFKSSAKYSPHLASILLWSFSKFDPSASRKGEIDPILGPSTALLIAS